MCSQSSNLYSPPPLRADMALQGYYNLKLCSHIIIVSFHDLHSPIVRPDHVYTYRLTAWLANKNAELSDYLIAVYPMLLMVIAYSLVELHGHRFRPVLYMWRPFHYFFARFRREWDLRTSIIDAFVTFFILSTTKLFSVSFHLLMPTELFTVYTDSLGLYMLVERSV